MKKAMIVEMPTGNLQKGAFLPVLEVRKCHN
jgi:hypothetical protein